MRNQDGYENDTMPGVCDYCGYRICPEKEAFTSTGEWNFLHERCTDGREGDA